jgi:hypothetical protein
MCAAWPNWNLRNGTGAPTSPAKAVGAGRNERMVRLVERQGEMLVQVVSAALAGAKLSLPPQRQQVVLRVIGRHMRELARS